MVSVPVASQLLHAVGYAMGAQLDGRQECALAYFGDGATSQGDFHEALQLRRRVPRAGGLLLPEQPVGDLGAARATRRAAPIHRKAEAYGFPGVRVDGNDVLAVYRGGHDAAAERARGGGGPTLIEARHVPAWRPHSTADDATRYQPRGGGRRRGGPRPIPLER